jgi:hypothetical protein
MYNEARDNFVIDEDTMPVVRGMLRDDRRRRGKILWSGRKTLNVRARPYATPRGGSLLEPSFPEDRAHNDAYRRIL